ncbi:MAG: hypothetical protein EAZ97_07245 [Bacteroidetes bacterium]|nr:MAG: hypothetical protein EAZ97_07245 [Bacteroidota bacterium]
MKFFLFILLSTSFFTIFAQDRYQTTAAKNFEIIEINEKTRKENYQNQIVYEFMNHFHKEAQVFQFYKDQTVSHYFRYKVEWKTADLESVLTVSWQSYGDGLWWNFLGETINRTPKELWQIVKDEKIKKLMKEYVKNSLSENEITDIFEFKTLECETSQKTENIDFNVEKDEMNGYGIVHKKTIFFFNEEGKFTNKSMLK